MISCENHVVEHHCLPLSTVVVRNAICATASSMDRNPMVNRACCDDSSSCDLSCKGISSARSVYYYGYFVNSLPNAKSLRAISKKMLSVLEIHECPDDDEDNGKDI
jgi:hypothetical protein